MKPSIESGIEKWSFDDCVNWLSSYGVENIDVVAIIADRLRELNEQHRWIPVSERLPTKEDCDKRGYVRWWSEKYGHDIATSINLPSAIEAYNFTHWRRIDTP